MLLDLVPLVVFTTFLPPAHCQAGTTLLYATIIMAMNIVINTVYANNPMMLCLVLLMALAPLYFCEDLFCDLVDQVLF